MHRILWLVGMLLQMAGCTSPDSIGGVVLLDRASGEPVTSGVQYEVFDSRSVGRVLNAFERAGSMDERELAAHLSGRPVSGVRADGSAVPFVLKPHEFVRIKAEGYPLVSVHMRGGDAMVNVHAGRLRSLQDLFDQATGWPNEETAQRVKYDRRRVLLLKVARTRPTVAG